MSQDKIKYSEIIALGFTEEIVQTDKVYFDQYGFHYALVMRQLTDTIQVYWKKETQLCEMLRVNEDGDVLGRIPIRNRLQLVELIAFFSDPANVSKTTAP